MNNKGQALSTFRGLIISLVVISFVVGIGFMLGSEVNTQVEDMESDDFCGTGYTYNDSSQECYNTSNTSDTTTASFTAAYNGTSEILDAMADIPGWIPLVIIAVIGLVLLALISRYQGVSR